MAARDLDLTIPTACRTTTEVTTMRTWLEGDQTTEDAEPPDVAALAAAGVPFWLDIEDPTDQIIDRLADALHLHPLAVSDSKEFDQRGKLVVYGDVAMMVGFGLNLEDGAPVEVHGYMTKQFLVTIRRQPSSQIGGLHRSGSLRSLLGQIRSDRYTTSSARFTMTIRCTSTSSNHDSARSKPTCPASNSTATSSTSAGSDTRGRPPTHLDPRP